MKTKQITQNIEYPKISIMIPSYNQELFVEEAIESALSQSYPNLEVVLSDDCSKDNTSEIARKYLVYKNFKYYKNKLNIGRVKNYKKALYDYVDGEWVLNLDGDDYLSDTNYLLRAMNAIKKYGHRKIVFVQAGHDIVFEGEHSTETLRCLPNVPAFETVLSGRDYCLHFDIINHFSHLSTLFQRNLALQLDFYRYNILSADMESLIRLALTGDVILLKQSVGVWRQHTNNCSSDLDFTCYSENTQWVEEVYKFAVQVNATFTMQQLNRWKKRLVAFQLSKYLSIRSLLTNKDKKRYILSYNKYLWKHFRYVYLNEKLLVKMFVVFFMSPGIYKTISRIGKNWIKK